MYNFDAAQAAAWLLVVFFAIGGIFNGIAPASIRNDYARWHYPPWFHYATAVCELAAAALLAFPETRAIGALLAACVMAGATVTLLWHQEYKHAIAPVAVLLLSITVFFVQLGWLGGHTSIRADFAI